METASSRIGWIDAARGIGIMLVVTGHLWLPGSRYIFWFHMPLFFLLSGMLFRPDFVQSVATHKARRLLIPYISYLFLFGIFEIIRFSLHSTPPDRGPYVLHLCENLLWGGRDLYGWYDVFWFAPVLFGASAVFTWFAGSRWGKSVPAVVFFLMACYILSLIDSMYSSQIGSWPFAINIIPLGIFYYGLGSYAARMRLDRPVLIVAAMILIAVSVGAVEFYGADLKLNMKWSVGGIPMVSVFIACSCSLIICYSALVLSKIRLVSRALVGLGGASITIMFLHRFVEDQILNRFHTPDMPLFRITAILIICWALHKTLSLNPITRLMFTGERSHGNRSSR